MSTQSVTDILLRSIVQKYVVDNDVASALKLASDPEDLESDDAKLLFQEIKRFLTREEKKGSQTLNQKESGHSCDIVYESADAFKAFIDYGSNVQLYECVHEALGQIYHEHPHPIHLLDIGVGTGRALVGALNEKVSKVDLLEPSASLLQECMSGIKQLEETKKLKVPEIVTHQKTIQQLMTDHQTIVDPIWDLAQATFSLQNIFNENNERVNVLKWLKKATKRLVIVEFNVSDIYHLPSLHPDRLHYLRLVMQKGISEYANIPDICDLVCQGFLIPMFFGYFDEGKKKINHEQSIDNWEKDLREAGFQKIVRKPLYQYWWADCVLIDAS